MILGLLEHLGVELPLRVVKLAVKFVPKGNRHRPEGTQATGQAGFLHPWSPLVPVTPSGKKKPHNIQGRKEILLLKS